MTGLHRQEIKASFHPSPSPQFYRATDTIILFWKRAYGENIGFHRVLAEWGDGHARLR
jgi:hypothetical protein